MSYYSVVLLNLACYCYYYYYYCFQKRYNIEDDYSYYVLENWSVNLETYAWQYNTGAHQSLGGLSPFNVFFGRESRGNITVFEMLPTSQGLKDNPSLLEDWEKDMDQILVKAQGNQQRSSDRMVLRHENKLPPSVYKKGDGVIVKLMKSDKKLKGKEKHL